MTVREFKATVLTPVHVGSGDRIAPEEYILERDRLVRFDSQAVLASMPAAGRAEYERMLDANRFSEALDLLRRAAAAGKHRLYEVRLGEQSQGELRASVADPNKRSGVVQMLQRNPYTGAIVVPGSSVKGAIRTAVLSVCVNAKRTDRPALEEAIQRAKSGEIRKR